MNMRISFVLPTVGLGGGIRVVAIYAKMLAERGHKVVLVSPPPQDLPLRRKIKSFLTGRGWPNRRIGGPSHLDGLGLEHRVLERSRAVGNDDLPEADVVVATWWETAEWVHTLSSGKGQKVYFVQGYEVHDHLPVVRSEATYRLPLRKIAVARWLKEVMEREYGDSEVELVPNAVDHSQFFAPERGKQRVPTVGFLYSRSGLKGVDVLVRVVARLRSQFANLRVIVFGAHLPPHGIGLDDGIEYYHAPAQDKIRDLYAQCDVWLSASRSEGFNLPAMEAMACRTPVVSTRVGWPEEAIESGTNGVLVDVDDLDSLTQGTAEVLALPDPAWRELSRRAYLTTAHCSWENSADLFEAALVRAARGEPVLSGR